MHYTSSPLGSLKLPCDSKNNFEIMTQNCCNNEMHKTLSIKLQLDDDPQFHKGAGKQKDCIPAVVSTIPRHLAQA